MNDDERQRLRNKIFAIEKQNSAFLARLRAFREAPLWKRVLIALTGNV